LSDAEVQSSQDGLLAYPQEDCMTEPSWQSLAHSRWEGK